MPDGAESWAAVMQRPDGNPQNVTVTLRYPEGRPVIETTTGVRITCIEPVPVPQLAPVDLFAAREGRGLDPSQETRTFAAS